MTPLDSEILACPRCKYPLDFFFLHRLACRNCGQSYEILDGIPHLIDTSSLPSNSAREEFDKNLAWFEQQHRLKEEPWDFSRRAAEILKREHVLLDIQRHTSDPNAVLDIGCSMGQLSRTTHALARRYFAIDISPSALRKASAWWEQAKEKQRPTFLLASATALPFQRESLDLIICMDGLHGMDMTAELQNVVLAECFSALRTGGVIIFTDYMRPEHFHELVQRVEQSPLTVVKVHYLYDRLWYQMESWFRMIGHFAWVKALFRSTIFARMLSLPSRLFGKYGSRHICIVAQKPNDR